MPASNPAYKGFTELYHLLMKPSSETIAFIQSIGVKYIVVDSSAEAWTNGANEMVLLNQVAGEKLFKLESTDLVSKEQALERIKELGS